MKQDNTLQIFESPEFGHIRSVEINGIIWFVGRDVAAALGYANTGDALARYVGAEDKQIFQKSGNAPFDVPNRGLTIINEGGLYSLIFSCKLPRAKKFVHWVTREVLHQIRKTGVYVRGDVIFARPQDYPSALRALADSLEKEKILERGYKND